MGTCGTRQGMIMSNTLLEDMIKAARVDEPRTCCTVNSILSDDRRSCTALERYADNAAVMAHLRAVRGRFAERSTPALYTRTLTVYGPANVSVIDGAGQLWCY